MEYYGQETILKESQDFTKINLKEDMKQILKNYLKKFNDTIEEWNYIICIYYNPDENNGYNSILVTNCNLNVIEYIFFDPIRETFYYWDFSPINSELKLIFRINLDCLSSTNPYIIFKNNNILEKFKEFLNFIQKIII